MKNQDLAKRIKELRSLKGLSQEELSERSGLSLRTVQRIENGETEPRGDSLRRLSMVLGDFMTENTSENKLKKDKGFLMITNFSALSFVLFPLFGIIAPFCLWVSKRKQISGFDNAGKQILNFQITWFIIFISGFLIVVSKLVSNFVTGKIDGGLMGNIFSMNLIFNTSIYLYNIIFIIINAIRINNEKSLKYFPSIPFFKKMEPESIL